MDGSRFDAWTRRRFGLAAGGLAGSLVALESAKVATASQKKKKKQRRCKKDGQDCGGRQKCCEDLICRPIEGLVGRHCCRDIDQPCTAMVQCCSGVCEGVCICKSTGSVCFVDANCCSGSCGETGCV
jgi:hypothetical protein